MATIGPNISLLGPDEVDCRTYLRYSMAGTQRSKPHIWNTWSSSEERVVRRQGVLAETIQGSYVQKRLKACTRRCCHPSSSCERPENSWDPLCRAQGRLCRGARCVALRASISCRETRRRITTLASCGSIRQRCPHHEARVHGCRDDGTAHLCLAA